MSSDHGFRNSDQLRSWYLRRTGHTPASFEDVRGLWYEELFSLNPALKLRKDLVIQFAEREGGLVLKACQLRWPEYWGGGSERRDLAEQARLLGATEDDLRRIARRVMAAIHRDLEAGGYYAASIVLPEADTR